MDKTYYRIVTLAWLSLAGIALAAEDSKASATDDGKAASSPEGPVQSAARPYDLSIVAPVRVAGSDAAAAAFQSEVLPGMLATLQQRLPENHRVSARELAAISLDPSKLVLSADANARVYFLGEGAGYRNTLGISTTGGGPLSPDAALIFPGASYTDGANGGGSTLGHATNAPLAAGDFVDLGSFKAGTALDFFLIANGTNTGVFFSTTPSLNQDGIIHAVNLAANGSAYLLVGFESTKGGGDRDYNDFLFAVEINGAKVNHMSGLAAPEPSLAFGALLAGGSLFGFRRRRQGLGRLLVQC